LIGYADVVITVSPSIADEYVLMYGIKRPALVLNAPEYKEVEKRDIFREKFGISKECKIFLYQGGLSPKRGILEFARYIDGRENLAYVIMGYGVLEDEIKEFAKSSENVFFHEAVPPDVLLEYTSSADIGICIEEPICRSWDYALANKLFEYLMVGLDVVVGGVSEMKRFVK
jgi:glycosyltransferase involved in cell wall biosynthesis